MSDHAWYKQAIIYALQVKTFYDSNGDGYGDIRGVQEKLDYLQDLGVNCLWLLPFYKSLGRDDGYDVLDHCQVDPRVGSLDDVRSLFREAKQRGFRIMIDLLADHTSSRHPWFQAARRSAGSPYHDFYIWSPQPIEGPGVAHAIFPGVEDGVWTFDEAANAYYFHVFYSHEPSLNNQNPAVQEEVEKIIRFWAGFGIDALRIDAATHVMADKPWERMAPNGFELLGDMQNTLWSIRPHGALMVESDVEPDEYAQYFDHVSMMLDFLFNNELFLALAREEAKPIVSALEHLDDMRGKTGQLVNYLRNFDELDLGRLQPKERQEVFKAFAPQEDERIYGRGIRRRMAPMLGGNQEKLKMVFSLLFSLPGTPLVFWGDEIGMGDDLSLPDRVPVRLPMQWSAGKNAGFSRADEDNLFRRPLADGPFGYEKVNVESQLCDPDSLLNFIKGIIHLRRAHPGIGGSHFEDLPVHDPHVLVHKLRSESESLLAVHNLSGRPQTLELPEGRYEEWLVSGVSRREDGSKMRLSIGPYGRAWYGVC